MRYWRHQCPFTRRSPTKLHTLVTLTEAGVIRAQRPDRLLRTAVTLIRWGATPAAGYEASAAPLPRTRSG